MCRGKRINRRFWGDDMQRPCSRRKHFSKLAVYSLALCTGSVVTSNALAQTSVTVYGLVDTGIEYLTNTGSGSLVREVAGNAAGSRWGLRGSESLGGNLTAIFVLENGFAVNDGTSSQSTKGLGANASTTTRLFGRQAYVGLKDGNQQITFGRQNSLEYDESVLFDPMSAAPRYSAFAIDYDWTGRVDNSIKYVGGFGPITVMGLYSTRYDTGYGSEVPGSPTIGRLFSGGVSYAVGSFGATILYEQRNSNTEQSATSSERRVFGAASYVFGNVTALAGYRYLRAGTAFLPTNPVPASLGSAASYASLFWAGARYRLTPFIQLTAAAYYQDVHRNSSSSVMGVLSGDYLLSKRTDLYATVAYARNDANANLGVNGYGSNVGKGRDQAGVVLGVRHKF
jgi:predicted porin